MRLLAPKIFIQLIPQMIWRPASNQLHVPFESLRRPLIKTSLPLDAFSRKVNFPLGVGLRRHNQPAVSLIKTRLRCLFCSLKGADDLLALPDVQVQCLALAVNPLPSQMFAEGTLPGFGIGPVRRDEDQHIAMITRPAAAVFQDVSGGLLRFRFTAPMMRFFQVQHDHPRQRLISDIPRNLWRDVRRREIAASRLHVPQTFLGFPPHLVVADLLRSVQGQPIHRRPRVIPMTAAFAVQISQTFAHPTQRVIKRGNRLARLHRPQPNANLLDAAQSLPDHRRRAANENGPRHPPTGHKFPQRRHILVKLISLGTLAVHIGIHNRRPVPRQILDHLFAHLGRPQRNRRRHNHQRMIIVRPKLMNHRRHHPQNAARALKMLQSRPVFIQPRKQFRVNRIGLPHPPMILAFSQPARKFAALRAVHIKKSA